MKRRRNARSTWIVGSALAIVMVSSHAYAGAANCPADLTGDDGVDGADLATLLGAWGLRASAANLDGIGTVDGADLAILLGAWGPCPPPAPTFLRYSGPLTGMPVTVITNAGPQVVAFTGSIDLLVTPSPSDGSIANVMPLTLNFIGGSAQVMGSTTGGIGLHLKDSPAPGQWNLRTGQLTLPLAFEVHYPLIDQFFPPIESGMIEEGTTVKETFVGQLSAQAVDNGGSMEVHGQILLTPQNPPLGAIGAWNLIHFDHDIPKKNTELPPGCPPPQRCNKLIACIQPVFIGTGPDDPDKSGSSFAAFKAEADAIWAKACIELEWKPPIYVNNNAYKEFDMNNSAAGRAERDALRAEVDPKALNDCIEVFFVETFVDDVGPHAQGDGMTTDEATMAAKVVVADDAIDDCDPAATRILAHELGHALGDCPHTTGTVMKSTGDPPVCPGLGPATITMDEINRVRGGLMTKPKFPKAECCTSPG